MSTPIANLKPNYQQFVFHCKDGQYITVGEDVIKESTVLTNMTLFTMVDDNTPQLHIISGKTMEHIINLCAFCKYEPPFNKQVKNCRPPEIDQIIQYFIRLPENQITELTEAIDFLDMPRLENYTLYFVLFLMKGKDLHELRKIFKLPDNYTNLEELQDLAKHC